MATKRKMVVVSDFGSIPELGGISGPVVSPTRIPMDAIKKMVINGRRVLECDPADPRNESKRIRLTINNMNEQNFGKFEATVQEEISRLSNLVDQGITRLDEMPGSGDTTGSFSNSFRSDEGEASEEGDAAEGQNGIKTEEVEEVSVEELLDDQEIVEDLPAEQVAHEDAAEGQNGIKTEEVEEVSVEELLDDQEIVEDLPAEQVAHEDAAEGQNVADYTSEEKSNTPKSNNEEDGKGSNTDESSMVIPVQNSTSSKGDKKNHSNHNNKNSNRR